MGRPMKHLTTYKLFESASLIPDEDYHQIREILANVFNDSPIFRFNRGSDPGFQFDVDDIKDSEYISYANIFVYGSKPEIQTVHGYQAIPISISIPIPMGRGWISNKKYRELERDMKPYIDKFESFLNEFGYYLRRSPSNPLNERYYDFAFFVTKSTQELPGFAHFRDTEFARDAWSTLSPTIIS